MNQSPFVQVPCVKCGTIVWIAPAAGMGYCPSCQTPNQLPPGAGAAPAGPPMGGYGPPPGGAPPGAPMGGYGAPPPMGGPPMVGAPMGGYGPPPGGGPPMGGAPMGGYGAPPGAGPPMGGPPMGGAAMGGPPMGGGYGAAPGAPGAMPQGGYGPTGGPPPPMVGFPTRSGGPNFKAIGGAVGTVLLVILVVVVKVGLRMAVRGAANSADTESLSNLGIDPKKADPDKMIAGARAYAIKWKSDAGFWSVNIQKMSSDGTVDVTNDNVMVEYFSPSAVSSPISSVRDDSIKKFNFLGDTMTFRDIWGVRKQYTPAPKPTSIPGCTCKKLATKLGQLGYFKSGPLHVQIDPAFGDEWLVQTPSGPHRFDLGTCTEKK